VKVSSREDVTDSRGILDYEEILSSLRENSPAAPKDISQSRYRENVIRSRCRDLCECRLVERVTHDVFSISERGVRYLDGDIDLPKRDGDINVDKLRDSPQWRSETNRITDLGGVDAETIKQFNYERYRDPEETYGLVDASREKTIRRIWNVQDADLRRIMREFPRHEPVVQQCAHWVRAISGKHFFPDANHRTAIGSLKALLRLNGIQPPCWPGKHLDRVVLKAKFVRNFVIDVRFDNLWRRDELYRLWHRHFKSVFYDLETTKHYRLSTANLGRVLDAARRQK